jgi:hypothetical protein
MARIFDPIYDPRQDSGSSGSEISDLNPERAYDTDLRRIEEDERGDVEGYQRQAGASWSLHQSSKNCW